LPVLPAEVCTFTVAFLRSKVAKEKRTYSGAKCSIVAVDSSE
jgi:hypothetical protein